MKSKIFDIEERINVDSRSPLRIAYGVGTFSISVTTLSAFFIFFLSYFLENSESFKNAILITTISISIILSSWLAYWIVSRVSTRRPLRIQISSESICLFTPEQKVTEISNRDLQETNWWSPNLHFLDSDRRHWKIPAYYAERGYAETSLLHQADESFLSGRLGLQIQNGKLQIVRIPQRSIPLLTRFFNHPLSRF